MNPHLKISTAFDPFLAASGPNDKRDAIVVYESGSRARQAAAGRGTSFAGAGRTLEPFKARVAHQKSIRAAVVAAYQRDAPRRLTKTLKLAASPVGSDVLPVSQVEVTRRTLPVLAEQPDVVAILPNQRLRAMEPTAVAYNSPSRSEKTAGLTWGLRALRIRELWEKTRGREIKVAVLDTGVHGNHRTLSGRVSKFLIVDPLGRRIEAAPTFDSGQHGTHVCGTIAGGNADGEIAIGVAPESELLVAGVLVGNATLRTLMEGIAWAIENGARIINMSFGFTYYEPLFARVFERLLDLDVLPVVAVGNECHGNSSSPGNVLNALSVGAVARGMRGRPQVAFFSSGASLVFPGKEQPLVTKPDLVAPGVRIYSCIPPEKRPEGTSDYSLMDGTSMAAPHVAGVAALLMAAHRNAEAADVAQALAETAKHPEGNQRRPDNRWGHGLVQPVEALKALES